MTCFKIYNVSINNIEQFTFLLSVILAILSNRYVMLLFYFQRNIARQIIQKIINRQYNFKGNFIGRLHVITFVSTNDSTRSSNDITNCFTGKVFVITCLRCFIAKIHIYTCRNFTINARISKTISTKGKLPTRARL